jgi:hypothetical protein
MANKKVGVINKGNVDFFIGYISSGNRPKKIPGDIVDRLTELADKAGQAAHDRQVRFAIKNDIDDAILIRTWTDEQRTLLESIYVSCYQELNDYIDTLEVTGFDLRTSFRNADNQRKHKLANKKHNFEVNGDLFYELKRMRSLCAELDMDFLKVIEDKNDELSRLKK